MMGAHPHNRDITGRMPVALAEGGILLIQLGDIGDVILTLPAVRAIRRRYPDRRLMVAVRDKAVDLMDDCPWVDETVCIRKRKRAIRDEIRYQWRFFSALRHQQIAAAVDLRDGTRGAILAFLSGAHVRVGRYAGDGHLWRNRLFTHLVNPAPEHAQYAAEHHFNILEPLDIPRERLRPEVVLPSTRLAEAGRLLSDAGVPADKPLAAFHPFSLWRYKEMPVALCAAVIDYLRRDLGFMVIITGAPDERDRARQAIQRCHRRDGVFNLAGMTTIGSLGGVLARCRLFVGVDTAALHLAAAVGTPTVGIFGPSSPRTWAPRGALHQVVVGDCPRQPCRQKGCDHSEQSRCLEHMTLGDIKPVLAARAAACQLSSRRISTPGPHNGK